MIFNKDQKLIWTYWHQGFDDAPALVKQCVKQIQAQHRDWKIHFLAANTVNEFIDPLPIRDEVLNKMLLAHRSDLIRTQLLIKYGGVWVDPTVFIMKPLGEWLPDKMRSGFFLYSRPGRDRIISNWFIAAEPNNPLLTKLYKELCDHWNKHDFRNLGREEESITEAWLNRMFNWNLEWPRIWFTPIMTNAVKLYPYFVYHYKFYDLLQNDDQCHTIWDQMPKVPAKGPHKLQQLGLLDPISEEAEEWVDQKKAPLFKLTRKLESDNIPDGSILHYLFKMGNS